MKQLQLKDMYNEYKKNWLKEHDYYDEYEILINMGYSVEKIEEKGFHGEIYACFNEWYDNEYQYIDKYYRGLKKINNRINDLLILMNKDFNNMTSSVLEELYYLNELKNACVSREGSIYDKIERISTDDFLSIIIEDSDIYTFNDCIYEDIIYDIEYVLENYEQN